MELHDTIKQRYSCRSFKTDRIEPEKLKKCVEAARLAPSAFNSQPWKFIIVSDEVVLKKIKPSISGNLYMNTFTENCPAFIVIVNEGDTVTSKIGSLATKKSFVQIDNGIAASYICLTATELGLSTCILGVFNEKRIKKILQVPKNKRVLLIIAMGYENEKPKTKGTRKLLKNIMAFDGYEGKEHILPGTVAAAAPPKERITRAKKK